MPRWSTWSALIAACCGLACSPEPENTDDVYPRNCGVEGPVDLFVYPAELYAPLEPERAGDYYLVGYASDPVTLHFTAVERCGGQPVPIAPIHDGGGLGVAGRWILECDPSDMTVWVHDPTGLFAPRIAFESAAGCRVVSVADGLAAQEATGGRVWFHPTPLEGSRDPILLTDAALPADPNDRCLRSFDCDLPSYSSGIKVDGDELLVVGNDESLLSFSPSANASRIVYRDAVAEAAVLGNGRYLAIEPRDADTFVVDREDESTFEFCCLGGLEPMKLLEHWLVRGSDRTPIPPDSESWTNFRALHLPSGDAMEVSGAEEWDPLAELTSNTLLIDIGAAGSPDKTRTVFWPSSRWRQPVELTGDTLWSSPTGDGVFAYDDSREARALFFLPSPDEPARKLLDGAIVSFANARGRIVYTARSDANQLRVLLPDETSVELAPDAVLAYDGRSAPSGWPVDTNEVLYLARSDDGTHTLKRTVLP